MIIRADSNDEDKVPKVGTTFVVTKAEKVAAFWIIELKDVPKGDSSQEEKFEEE